MGAEVVIVDAMNVIGSRPDGWWKDPKKAMREFARAVDAYARQEHESVTVVFDSDPGGLPETTHIEVVIASRRGRNAADYEIARLVAQSDDPKLIRIVTSDRDLIDQVKALGARVISVSTFRDNLDP